MATSNTDAVFRETVGKRIVGLYKDRESEFSGTVIVLVLDDGSGFAFGTGNGSHWTVSREDVALRVNQRRAELSQLERDLRDVLKAEAVLP